MEKLAKQWANFKHPVDESCEIFLVEATLLEANKNGERCLVGKIHIGRTIQKEIVHAIMLKI